MANNPFDKVTNQYAAAQAQAAQKKKACPTCGHVDDVAEPDQKSAADFVKGTEQQPDYIANIKKGLGFGS